MLFHDALPTRDKGVGYIDHTRMIACTSAPSVEPVDVDEDDDDRPKIYEDEVAVVDNFIDYEGVLLLEKDVPAEEFEPARLDSNHGPHDDGLALDEQPPIDQSEGTVPAAELKIPDEEQKDDASSEEGQEDDDDLRAPPDDEEPPEPYAVEPAPVEAQPPILRRSR